MHLSHVYLRTEGDEAGYLLLLKFFLHTSIYSRYSRLLLMISYNIANYKEISQNRIFSSKYGDVYNTIYSVSQKSQKSRCVEYCTQNTHCFALCVYICRIGYV